MAGTLEISSHDLWMPAGWIYDGVLHSLAAELESSDPSLSQLIRNGRTEVGGYCDLTSLSPVQFQVLLHAAEKVLSRLRLEGPATFSNGRQYPAFMNHLSKLVELLRGDERNKSPRGGVG